MYIISSPLSRMAEIEKVASIINNCKCLHDTGVISILIDKLQESQPNEIETIRLFRNILCDMSFKYFIEKYPKK